MASSVCDLNMYTNVDARDCTQELCKHRWRVCAESQLWAKRSLAATDGVWTSIHSYCHWLLRPMLYQLSHILPLDNRHFDYLLLSATPNSESRPPLQPFISSTPCVDGHSDARGTDQNCLGEEGAVYRELCCRNGTSRASKLCEKDAIKSNISSRLSTIGSITPGLRQNSLFRKIDVAMMKKKTRTKKMQHWLADCWISRPAPLRSVPMTFSGVGSGRSSLRVRIALMVRSMLPDISWSQSCTGKQRKVVLRVNSVVHTPYTHITITNNPPHTHTITSKHSLLPPKKNTHKHKTTNPHPLKRKTHTPKPHHNTWHTQKWPPPHIHVYTWHAQKWQSTYTQAPSPPPTHTYRPTHTQPPPPQHTHPGTHTHTEAPSKKHTHTAPPSHTHRPIHTHTHTMSQLLKLQVPGPYTALRWSPHCAALPPPWSRRRTGAAWSLLRTSPSLARTLICPGSWPRWNETLKRQRKPHVTWRKKKTEEKRRKRRRMDVSSILATMKWNTEKAEKSTHDMKNPKKTPKEQQSQSNIPFSHSQDLRGWLVSKTSDLLTVTLSTHATWLSWLTGVKNQ